MSKPRDTTQGVGDHFQQTTKYRRGELGGGGLDWSARPEPYRVYSKPLALIALPPPDRSSGAPLWATVAERRSVRDYSPAPLKVEEVSQLLWAAQGITAGGNHALRAAPSAGALYPIESYLVVNNVTGLQPGVYHYRVVGHQLELIREGRFGDQLADAALGQEMCAAAPVVFVWTAIIQRSRWKYKQRAYRYIYLDAGHIAAHVSLAAVALGLGSCQIGAFFDEEVDAIIRVDGREEFAVYLTSVGHL